MRLNTSYCMLYVLIFNKPFLANFVSSKKCLHLFIRMYLCQYGIEMCIAYIKI
jgi:hypothetical protein